MSSFLVWRQDTKEIVFSVTGLEGTVPCLESLTKHLTPDWENVYLGADIPPSMTTAAAKDLIYVDEDDQWQYRPEMPITVSTATPVIVNGEGVTTISEVPIGSEVFIDGVSQGVTTESPFELSFDLPGSYLAVFRKYPYLDREVTFDATY